jgi:hypothetical protein
VGGDAGEDGRRAVGGETERDHKCVGGVVPPVGRHNEQPVAAHGRRLKGAGWERELQLHAWPSVRLRACDGVADWLRRGGGGKNGMRSSAME